MLKWSNKARDYSLYADDTMICIDYKKGNNGIDLSELVLEIRNNCAV